MVLACAPMIPLFGQVRSIPLAPQPSAFFVDSVAGRLHLLTLGRDVDFDGVYEPEMGDLLPVWYILDPASEQVLSSRPLDGFFNNFPIRIGIDRVHSLVYLPQNGRVRAFDYATQNLVSDVVEPGKYAAASFDEAAGALLLADRPGFSDPGHLMITMPATHDTVGIFETAPNTAMSVGRANDAIAAREYFTISEGSPKGAISYAAVSRDIFATVNGKPLGGGAAQIVVAGERAYVVLNGTHEIAIVDLRTHRRIGASIPTGTSGFDGPRSLALQGDSIAWVGTYHGDVRRIDLRTGALTDSIALSGKVEAVALRDTLLFAAVKYDASYKPDSLVMVIGLKSRAPIDSIKTGAGPGALLVDRRGDLHVLGYGDNDTLGWWMIFDGATRAPKGARQLHGHLGFPLRVGYDAGGGAGTDSLFVAIADTLFGFAAAEPAAAPRLLFTDSTMAGGLTGAAAAGPYVTVSEVPGNFGSDPSYVHVIRRADGHRVAKVRAGSFLATAVPLPASLDPDRPGLSAFYALSEGTFGAPSSSITYFAFAEDILNGDTIGAGPNHILLDGDRAWVTVNGNNTVARVDLKRWRVDRRIAVGTTGFDGPRESLLLPNGDLAVTTYAGDMRVIHDGVVTRTIRTGERAEGLAMFDGKLFVANPLKSDYSVDSTVAVIDLAQVGVRRESAASASVALEQNVPNPASSAAVVRFTLASAGDVLLTVHAIDGRPVATVVEKRMEAGSYAVDLPVAGLPAGSYLYTLRAGGETLTRVMKVVR